MSIIDYELKYGKIRNKETLKNEARRTIRLLIITLTIMIIALSVTFLLTTNSGSQKGYTLQQLKIENQQLKSQELELATKVNDSTSFSNLEENEKVSGMQKTEVKSYITPEDNKIRK
jgi:uncharacterized membrane protein